MESVNWKTTLIGAAMAAVTALTTFQSNGGNLGDWKLYALPVLTDFLGYFAKDKPTNP